VNSRDPIDPAASRRAVQSKCFENPRLEGRLRSYVLAATAAGVGLLASAVPASAEVVYTPANVQLSNGQLKIDFDGDGVTDVTIDDFFNGGFFRSNRQLLLQGAAGASVIEHQHFVAALGSGYEIGSNRAFTPLGARQNMANVGYSCATSSACWIQVNGPWVHATDRYVGVKFEISGATHYGWVRLSTYSRYMAGGESKITARMTGYAYETTPGQSIVAGPAGQAELPQQNARSLGELALGAVARK
jgi:hypothetical protein